MKKLAETIIREPKLGVGGDTGKDFKMEEVQKAKFTEFYDKLTKTEAQGAIKFLGVAVSQCLFNIETQKWANGVVISEIELGRISVQYHMHKY